MVKALCAGSSQFAAVTEGMSAFDQDGYGRQGTSEYSSVRRSKRRASTASWERSSRSPHSACRHIRKRMGSHCRPRVLWCGPANLLRHRKTACPNQDPDALSAFGQIEGPGDEHRRDHRFASDPQRRRQKPFRENLIVTAQAVYHHPESRSALDDGACVLEGHAFEPNHFRPIA